ncbi:MAG: hypothetical protein MK085_03220, partial [Phycisphaerales bacterium]|nr:hypothetical protein [Phycisphaerales bacterium]
LLVQLDPMRIVFEPAGTELVEYLKVWPKSTVPVTIEIESATGKEVFHGELDLVDNSLNSATSTFVARAEFPNTDLTVLPGLFGSVQVKLGTLKDQLVIPSSAVYSELQLQYVWTVDSKNTLARKLVDVTKTYEGMSMVTGLKKGEMIVVEGNPMGLQPGAPVTPTTETIDQFIKDQSKNAAAANARVSGQGSGSKSDAAKTGNGKSDDSKSKASTQGSSAPDSTSSSKDEKSG